MNNINPRHYHAPVDLLKDKVILVTGAGDGIGRSAALSYAKHGATVILVGRTMSKLEQTYDDILAQQSPTPAISPLSFDSATVQEYQALHDSIADEFGQLHGLLNNASELGPRKPLAQYPAEQWQRIMQVNVHAPFMLTQAMLPLMSHNDGSSIIFTGSSVGIKGRAYWGAYAVSKAATENMVQVFADEMEGISRIRVNSINPGATRTSMRQSAYPAEDPNKLSHPDELMPSYLFLMGKDSEGVNGQQFNAQGD